MNKIIFGVIALLTTLSLTAMAVITTDPIAKVVGAEVGETVASENNSDDKLVDALGAVMGAVVITGIETQQPLRSSDDSQN